MQQDKIKHEHNKAQTSALRTIIKKTVKAIEGADKTQAEDLLKSSFSAIDRASKKNIIHRNTAARKKSRLAKRLAQAS